MSWRVIIAGTDAEWAERLCPALAAAGCEVVATLDGDAHIERAVRRLQPDVVVIHTACPRRDTLEHLAVVARGAPRPVVMLCEQDDAALLRVAAEAGVSLYAVDVVSAPLLRSLLNAAVGHFRKEASLRAELDATRRAAEERRVIDRAKCVLMERESLSESESYHRMRKLAMREGQKLAEVAVGILNGVQAL